METKAFSLDIMVKDPGSFMAHFETHRKTLVDDIMRGKGYVPVLDKDFGINSSYDIEKDIFNYVLVCYGVYVGKDKAWSYAGKLKNKLIPTPKAKLGKSSNTLE
jgi:hypothetical protein